MLTNPRDAIYNGVSWVALQTKEPEMTGFEPVRGLLSSVLQPLSYMVDG